MRNYLYRLAEIVAAALLVDYRLVDASGSDIVRTCCVDVGETLVMSKVKIRLMAVDGHIAFPVLIGIECTRVDVDVGVEFLDCYTVASGKEKAGKRRRYDAFA